MTKVGRNDPCPCGSGKKYKKCCLKKDVEPVASLIWQKMRRTEGELIPVLLKHAEKYYGPEAFTCAWDEFTLWKEVPMDPELEPEMETIFIPWFLFNCIPESDEDGMTLDWPELPVAMHYLENEGSRLDSFQRRFIEEACSQPYSFFLVTAVDPGKSLSLRDLLLKREVTVQERQASTLLHKGDIIFARIITMDDVSIMLGCASTVIAANYANYFIDMREEMQDKFPGYDRRELLYDDIDLFAIYYDIRERVRNPSPPKLQNTDGEPLQPTKLHYTLQCSPREALDALISLSLADVDDFIEDGEFDAQGELFAIEFPWLKKGNKQQASWENTVLGHISIEGQELIIDVNSQQRADAIKRKISRRLGRKAVFRNAVIQSVEKMLEEMQNNPAEGPRPADSNHEELMAQPEVQEMMQEMAVQFWQEWLDTSIPALKDQTPREAAKTAIGRERLEALLLDFESRGGKGEPFGPDIDALRRTLGLD